MTGPKLCKLATYIFQGKRVWNRSSESAIAEAKRRGLSCSATGSTLTSTSSSCSGNCSSNIKACSQKELCFEGTFINHAGLSTWQNNAEAKEAKRRGLNCDVLANTAYRIEKNCTEDVKVCTEASLCSFAAKGDSDSRKWNPYWPAHVTEAKLRGVSCGIRTTLSPLKARAY